MTTLPAISNALQSAAACGLPGSRAASFLSKDHAAFQGKRERAACRFLAQADGTGRRGARQPVAPAINPEAERGFTA